MCIRILYTLYYIDRLARARASVSCCSIKCFLTRNGKNNDNNSNANNYNNNDDKSNDCNVTFDVRPVFAINEVTGQTNPKERARYRKYAPCVLSIPRCKSRRMQLRVESTHDHIVILASSTKREKRKGRRERAIRPTQGRRKVYSSSAKNSSKIPTTVHQESRSPLAISAMRRGEFCVCLSNAPLRRSASGNLNL